MTAHSGVASGTRIPGRSANRNEFLRQASYGLAGALAEWQARQSDSPIVRGLGSNLAVLYGLPEGSAALERQVNKNLQNLLECYADLLQLALREPDTIDAACALAPEALKIIDGHLASGRGVLFVSPHMCSMDILLLALSKRYRDMQVLSKASPGLNTRVINHLRSRYGLRMTPISPASLRDALRRLRSGGLVGIAADLPAPDSAPLFFLGMPCYLPLGFARLALASDASIVVGTSRRVGVGQFEGLGHESPPPRNTGHPREDAIRWAQAVIEVVEGYILDRPSEWFMPLPLWPAQELDPVVSQRLKLTSEGIW